MSYRQGRVWFRLSVKFSIRRVDRVSVWVKMSKCRAVDQDSAGLELGRARALFRERSCIW